MNNTAKEIGDAYDEVIANIDDFEYNYNYLNR